METRRASCSTGRQAPDQAPAPEIVSPFKPGQVPGFFFSAYRKFRATWPPGTWFPEWPPAWWNCAPGGAGNPSTGLVGLNLAARRGRLTLNHCARYQLRAPGAGAWPTWCAVIAAAVISTWCSYSSCSYSTWCSYYRAGLADQVQLIATRCDLVELRGPGRPGASAGAGVCMWIQTCRLVFVCGHKPGAQLGAGRRPPTRRRVPRAARPGA